MGLALGMDVRLAVEPMVGLIVGLSGLLAIVLSVGLTSTHSFVAVSH